MDFNEQIENGFKILSKVENFCSLNSTQKNTQEINNQQHPNLDNKGISENNSNEQLNLIENTLKNNKLNEHNQYPSITPSEKNKFDIDREKDENQNLTTNYQGSVIDTVTENLPSIKNINKIKSIEGQSYSPRENIFINRIIDKGDKPIIEKVFDESTLQCELNCNSIINQKTISLEKAILDNIYFSNRNENVENVENDKPDSKINVSTNIEKKFKAEGKGGLMNLNVSHYGNEYSQANLNTISLLQHTTNDNFFNNTNVQLVKQDRKSNLDVFLCRICYEGENDDKGGIISPCVCTGTCQYIHESCLKTWIIKHNASVTKFIAQCEICKTTYDVKFLMKYRFTHEKILSFFKSFGSISLLSTVLLVLTLAVIYVVITAITDLTNEGKKILSTIFACLGILVNIIFLAIFFRNCRKNFYAPYFYDWKIFNMNESENEKNIKIRELKKAKCVKSNNLPDGKYPNFHVVEHDNSNIYVGFDIILNNDNFIRFYNNPLVIQDEFVILN